MDDKANRSAAIQKGCLNHFSWRTLQIEVIRAHLILNGFLIKVPMVLDSAHLPFGAAPGGVMVLAIP